MIFYLKLRSILHLGNKDLKDFFHIIKEKFWRHFETMMAGIESYEMKKVSFKILKHLWSVVIDLYRKKYAI